MELIAEEKPFNHLKDKAFLTGILSNLDAILNLPMKDVVKDFIFSQDIKFALTNEQGELSELLALAKYYEVPNRQNGRSFVATDKISEATLLNCYYETLKWGVSIV